MTRIMAFCCAGMLTVSVAAGEDWPQFGGLGAYACSAETGLARTWPAGGPKVLWTVKMGAGYGGAAIRDGKVYVLDRPDSRKDNLRCLDLLTGKEEWNFSYSAPGGVDHDGSRSTPAVDDKYVFTVGPFGDVHCIDKASHEVVWRKHLLKDYGGRLPKWGVAQSPLLYKDRVILAPQSGRTGVVALARDTGKELWRSEEIGRMHYVSPIVTTLDGVDQVVAIGGSGVAGVDAASGKVLWKYTGWRCRISIPNVTPIGDGRLFITGGYRAGSAMIRVARSGEAFAARELFKDAGCNSQMNPALLYKDHLYILANSNRGRDGLVCKDLDGKTLWKTGRDPNFERGHMLWADDMLYVIDGRAGSLHLVEPSTKGFKELARADDMLGGKEIWAPLVLSDGKLVIRDQRQMKCLDVKAK